jgi:uncharacterized protein with PQ loop repeat
MVILPPARPPAAADSPPLGVLDRILSAVSVLTMLSTVPQVLNVWLGPPASGVSLISWASYLLAAFLWFVHGVQKRDKSIYLACIGWIILNASVVLGIVVRR